jgi:hypothetical protein
MTKLHYFFCSVVSDNAICLHVVLDDMKCASFPNSSDTGACVERVDTQSSILCKVNHCTEPKKIWGLLNFYMGLLKHWCMKIFYSKNKNLDLITQFNRHIFKFISNFAVDCKNRSNNTTKKVNQQYFVFKYKHMSISKHTIFSFNSKLLKISNIAILFWQNSN